MIVRSLGPALAIGCFAVALLACSPPAQEPPAPEIEAQAAPLEPPEKTATPRRRERRAIASADTQAAGEYRYIDERGQVRMAARIEDIPERQRSTASTLLAPSARARYQDPSDDSRAIQAADVTIFTTPSCGYCRAAMAHFDKLGIDYTNRDVEADEEARAEYLELTGGRRGVPVIVVGDSWIQGWSQPEFERLVASAAR